MLPNLLSIIYSPDFVEETHFQLRRLGIKVHGRYCRTISTECARKLILLVSNSNCLNNKESFQSFKGGGLGEEEDLKDGITVILTSDIEAPDFDRRKKYGGGGGEGYCMIPQESNYSLDPVLGIRAHENHTNCEMISVDKTENAGQRLLDIPPAITLNSEVTPNYTIVKEESSSNSHVNYSCDLSSRGSETNNTELSYLILKPEPSGTGGVINSEDPHTTEGEILQLQRLSAKNYKELNVTCTRDICTNSAPRDLLVPEKDRFDENLRRLKSVTLLTSTHIEDLVHIKLSLTRVLDLCTSLPSVDISCCDSPKTSERYLGLKTSGPEDLVDEPDASRSSPHNDSYVEIIQSSRAETPRIPHKSTNLLIHKTSEASPTIDVGYELKTLTVKGSKSRQHDRLSSPSEHPIPKLKLLRCPDCLSTFTKHVDLRTHVKDHRAGFRCHICQRGFARRNHLTSHMRAHTGRNSKQNQKTKERIAEPFCGPSQRRRTEDRSCTDPGSQVSRRISKRSSRLQGGEHFTLQDVLYQPNSLKKATHRSSIECPICGRIMLRPCGLPKHMSTHSRK